MENIELKSSLQPLTAEVVAAAELVIAEETGEDIETGAFYLAGQIHVPRGTPFRDRILKTAGALLAAVAILDERAASSNEEGVANA